jgi:hypothetical protein
MWVSSPRSYSILLATIHGGVTVGESEGKLVEYAKGRAVRDAEGDAEGDAVGDTEAANGKEVGADINLHSFPSFTMKGSIWSPAMSGMEQDV